MAKTLKSSNFAQKVYLTPKGLEDAQLELKFLKDEKRKQVADRIERAREFGDVEENSEYDAALEEQTIVENRIAYLDGVLRNANIISEAPKKDFVVIGSTVVVQIDSEVDEFTIVGKLEANPLKKRISNESPMGTSLLGAKAGEEVEVVTPIVRYRCKVLEVR